MKITIIGSGYVGLVTGACFADTGTEVCCVDKNQSKIKSLKKGIVPIYEPGLEPLLTRGLTEGRLCFTTDLKEGLAKAEICFLTVDTPSQEDGTPDLSNIFAVADQIGAILENPILVVTKSTVPVGTTAQVKEIIRSKLKEQGKNPDWVAAANNPEFLKEGTSVHDFRYPDRIVVGVETGAHSETLRELYEPFMRKKDCFLSMDIPSSELCKYAANAMLAARISFMNEMAALCEKVGGNIDAVRQAIGWDPRIGNHFLYPGLGYGGSCLPKDVLALMEMGKEYGLPLSLIQSVDKTNRRQREIFLEKIVSHFGSLDRLKGRHFALWGLSFKPETDDIRQAPSLYLISKLTELGTTITAFDPVAASNVKSLIGDKIGYAQNNYECLEGADALLIATEWNEFRSPDFAKIKRLMKKPLIFDGRNLYSPQKMKDLGFDYFSIGR